YGEAKISEANQNVGVLANDLLRLAVMTAKAVNESNMSSLLAFQIHGKVFLLDNFILEVLIYLIY
ncbi:hypothetical protein BD770DRAFT_314860, partial [Pilaira anomala]